MDINELKKAYLSNPAVTGAEFLEYLNNTYDFSVFEGIPNQVLKSVKRQITDYLNKIVGMPTANAKISIQITAPGLLDEGLLLARDNFGILEYRLVDNEIGMYCSAPAYQAIVYLDDHPNKFLTYPIKKLDGFNKAIVSLPISEKDREKIWELRGSKDKQTNFGSLFYAFEPFSELEEEFLDYFLNLNFTSVGSKLTYETWNKIQFDYNVQVSDTSKENMKISFREEFRDEYTTMSLALTEDLARALEEAFDEQSWEDYLKDYLRKLEYENDVINLTLTIEFPTSVVAENEFYINNAVRCRKVSFQGGTVIIDFPNPVSITFGPIFLLYEESAYTAISCPEVLRNEDINKLARIGKFGSYSIVDDLETDSEQFCTVVTNKLKEFGILTLGNTVRITEFGIQIVFDIKNPVYC